jgi:hypothetical protein
MNHIHLFHYNMFYLKVSFHVFNYKDKQNQNRPPPSINLVPNRLNVQDRFVTCQIYDLIFLMVNNSLMCVAFFRWFDLIFGVLTPLSPVCQLYHGDQLWWWRKPEYPERTTDPGQETGKLYHLRLRVECTLIVIYKAGREATLYWRYACMHC